MATKEVPVTLCDPCLAAGVERYGETRGPWPLNGRASVTLDLCEEHEAEIVGPLVDALKAYGVKVDGRTRRGRELKSA